MNLDSSLSYGEDVGDARLETIVIMMFLLKKNILKITYFTRVTYMNYISGKDS